MNGYLLDTNVPSEFSRDRPEPRVVKWLKAQPVTTLFLSAITIGEIRKGLVVTPQGRRRVDLETWFHTDLLVWFRNRVLPVTHAIADRWGELDGQSQLTGRPLNTADGLNRSDSPRTRSNRGDAQRQRFRRPRRCDLRPVGATVAGLCLYRLKKGRHTLFQVLQMT